MAEESWIEQLLGPDLGLGVDISGFRTGYGTYYYADGRSFVGIFLNDQREGPVSFKKDKSL